jgi:hypothetical protein
MYLEATKVPFCESAGPLQWSLAAGVLGKVRKGRVVKNDIRTFDIPKRNWKSVLDGFTQKHSGLPVELETYDRETEEHITSPTAALHSLTLDLEEAKNPRINVTVLSGNKEIRHILFRPSQLVLHASRRNGDEALMIESVNTETTVRLKRRRPPELLNRVA